MRVYLDEMLSPKTAALGRLRGLDVTCTEELGRKGTNDQAQLTFAAEQNRCLVTKNFDDFDLLTQRFMAENPPHAGVAFVSKSIRSDNFAAIVDGLIEAAGTYPDGLPPYAVIWLNPPHR